MSCLLSPLSVIRIDQKFFVGIFVPFGVNWLSPVSREDLAAGAIQKDFAEPPDLRPKSKSEQCEFSCSLHQ